MGMMRAILGTVSLVAVLTAAPHAYADDPKSVAFFGLEFVNTSPGATTPEEEQRLAAMAERLVAALAASGRYEFVDISPVAEEAGRYASLAHCYGCDARLAAKLGADLAMTGEVQKTSNLILSVSIFMRDAGTGNLVGGGSADMRGNTDESWRRAFDYIVRNRILKD